MSFRRGCHRDADFKTNRDTSSVLLGTVIVTDTAGIIAGTGPAPGAPEADAAFAIFQSSLSLLLRF